MSGAPVFDAGGLVKLEFLNGIHQHMQDWEQIRVPYPFQWGAPTFDAGEAFAMMAASFIALVEGIGILLDGLFGTVNGSTVSV
ncbi:hypothetical protein ACLOJK_004083 [Asimina triloba]